MTKYSESTPSPDIAISTLSAAFILATFISYLCCRSCMKEYKAAPLSDMEKEGLAKALPDLIKQAQKGIDFVKNN